MPKYIKMDVPWQLSTIEDLLDGYIRMQEFRAG
jgi:hypothetical protein